MGIEEENPNSIYIFPDLLENIFLRLPLKSILKCKTVSKQWRSILESKRFAKKRMSLPNSRKILAAYNCDCGGRPSLLPESRFKGDEEIVYLHCDAARPSMTCEGLVCFPEQDWIIVLNPATRQFRRFSSGLNHKCRFGIGIWSTFDPAKWAMGFGRDKVTGSFKVVRMCFSYREIGQKYPVVECGILNVKTGEWKKLIPPHYVVNARSKSVCVNGSIYWLHFSIVTGYMIIALDLDKEKFRYVKAPGKQVTRDTQIVNLENRLVIAKTTLVPEWKLEIWSMDTYKKQWSKSYSISLEHRVACWQRRNRWFTPVAVSKKGNLVFYDNKKRLFKYYPRTDKIRCLSLNTCVISHYVENLVSLPLKPSQPDPDPVKMRISRCRLFQRPNDWINKALNQSINLVFVSLVLVGYICLPL